MLEQHQADASYANNCLLARRLIERGVRFVQLNHEGHGIITTTSTGVSRSNAPKLIKPARRWSWTSRGEGCLMTLLWSGVVNSGVLRWLGPDVEGVHKLGRDHHNKAFSVWLAGGGFDRGSYGGKTNELSVSMLWKIAFHVHDLHATVLLHQLGFYHEKLTYRFQGRGLPADRCPRCCAGKASCMKTSRYQPQAGSLNWNHQ